MRAVGCAGGVAVAVTVAEGTGHCNWGRWGRPSPRRWNDGWPKKSTVGCGGVSRAVVGEGKGEVLGVCLPDLGTQNHALWCGLKSPFKVLLC